MELVDPGDGRQIRLACVRTMVRRNDVPVLSFFRGNGFRGGSFVQLELDVREAARPSAPVARRLPRRQGRSA